MCDGPSTSHQSEPLLISFEVQKDVEWADVNQWYLSFSSQTP